MRYNLNINDIPNYKEEDLFNVILRRDEELLNKFNSMNLQTIKLGLEKESELEALSKAETKIIQLAKETPILKNQPSKQQIGNSPYHLLIEKLFGDVRATEDNPNVERSITITIKDSIKPKE